MRVEETPSQKTGRALIVVSGILLVAVISQLGQREGGPVGSREWWRAVLAATFDARKAGPVTWTLLALFGLGNALNLHGLWHELKSFRFSIGQLMAAVSIAALLCFLLRFWPPAGLVVILAAALSPAWLIKSARRRDPFRS
jgi:hypothetical protein